MSGQNSETTILENGRVLFIRRDTRSNVVLEKWEGTLAKDDIMKFKKSILDTCGFFSLPQRPAAAVRIKDSSWDTFVVSKGTAVRSIGGYGARHCKEYRPLYTALNDILKKVKGKRYFVNSLRR